MTTSSDSNKLGFGEKLAFAGGVFPSTCTTVLGGYALFYYTDVFGISAAAAGTMMLVLRVWDSLWDLVVGRWVDVTRTKHGQARPFLRWAGGALLATYLLTFYVPDLAAGPRLVYACITYALLQMAYSLVTMPYNALLAALTPDHEERTRTAGLQSFVLFLSVVFVGAATFPLVQAVGHGDMKRGFFLVTAGYGVLGAILMWNAFRGTRERVPLPAPASARQYAAGLLRVARCRSWQAMVVMQLLYAAALGMSLSTTIYYMRYLAGRPELVGPYMGVGGLGLLAGVVLGDRLSRRFCKRSVAATMFAVTGVLQALFWVVPPSALPLVFALGVLSSLTTGATAPLTISMNADTVDDIEFNTGQRLVGASISTIFFANKVGSSIGGSLPGLIFGAAGYMANAPTQSAPAQQAILLCMSLLPAAFTLVTAVVMVTLYPLNRRTLQAQQAELARRRAGAAGDSDAPSPAASVSPLRSANGRA